MGCWQSVWGRTMDCIGNVPRVNCSRCFSTVSTVLLLIVAAIGSPLHAQYVSPFGVNSVTNTIYVANLGTNNTVTVIDGATGATATVPGGGNPVGVAVNSVTNKIYVIDAVTPGTVTVIDGATNATATVNVGSAPEGIAVNSVTNKIYVANYGGNTVTVIDGATNATSAVTVGNSPWVIAVNSVTNTIYVGNLNSDTVSVIDGATNTVTATVPVSTVSASIQAIAVNSVTNTIYVVNSSNNTVTVINGATNATSTVNVGVFPKCVVVDSVTNTIYVVNAGGQTVTVINGATNTVTAAVPVGMQPNDIAVDSVTNKIYVANYASQTVTVIDGATNATSAVTDGSGPLFVAVNSVTNTVYVLNFDGTRTVFAGAGSSTGPTITAQPTAQTIATGSTVVFTAAVGGIPAPTLQWNLNGAAIAGATSATLVVSNSSPASAGSYTLTATNSSGTITSSPAVLTVSSTPSPGRLINLSMLSDIQGSLSMGFVTGGAGTSGSETLLIRGVGPSIGPGTVFDVPGVMTDPTLTVVQQNGDVTVATNSGWGANQAAVSAADAATGAFALTNPASLDSAVVVNLPSVTGGYSATVAGKSGDNGYALTEVYDDTTNYIPASTRLINLSCLTQIAVGGALDVGFVVGGTTAKTVLVRVGGPALSTLYNIAGVMPDPQLQVSPLSNSATALVFNAGWGGNPQIASVAASVGAYAFPSASSLDSAALVTLPPGPYTVQVSSKTGLGGTVLVEIYAVP
jgi:YVTN family beta-propeller protein